MEPASPPGRRVTRLIPKGQTADASRVSVHAQPRGWVGSRQEDPQSRGQRPDTPSAKSQVGLAPHVPLTWRRFRTERWSTPRAPGIRLLWWCTERSVSLRRLDQACGLLAGTRHREGAAEAASNSPRPRASPLQARHRRAACAGLQGESIQGFSSRSAGQSGDPAGAGQEEVHGASRLVCHYSTESGLYLLGAW